MMNTRILIVEDDLESLKLIGLMLQRRGYEIIAANTGGQALRKVETEKPDLVILDVMMPDMDGYQVCRKIRANPQTAQIPVMMFTAKSLAGDKATGYQAGADDYLTKPIHPTELVSHVEGLLQRFEQEGAAAGTRARAHVIGVIGAKGGVGTSTVAVNLAMAACQLSDNAQGAEKSPDVSIIDLRPGLGTVALLLGKPPGGGWTAIVDQSAHSLNLENHVLTHKSGLRYLPASPQPEKGQSNLSPEHVDAVISTMVATADYLFLDLGCVLDDATRRAVGLCDKIVVVVEPERLCLYLAQVLLEKIMELEPVPDDVRMVLVERSPSNASFSEDRVEKVLGRDLVSVIKAAPTVVRQAAEQGEPFVLSHPESEIAGQFRDLVWTLLV